MVSKNEQMENDEIVDVFHVTEETCETMFKYFNLDKPPACINKKDSTVCSLTIANSIDKIKLYENNGKCSCRKKQLKYDTVMGKDSELMEVYYFECGYKK